MTAMQEADGISQVEPVVLPRRVLVAEDELLLARMLSELLTSLDIEVIGPASNGRAAIELAKAHQPDLAVLDIRMPEVDGLEAAQVLHRELGLPVVMLTAYSDDTFVQQSCQAGVCGYLLKPITLDELRVGLAMAWRQHQTRRELTEQVGQLEQKLRDRKVIERAKGVMMKREGMDEEMAMRHLQRLARDHRRPMVAVAKEILDAAEGAGESPR